MFKFDTQKQLAGARAERQGRIMASFLGRRTSRLGILRPYWYQFSDQACAQLPDLSTWSLSHSDGSPLSAPCPYLARADRVAEYLPVQVTAAVVSSHSSVCLWSVCRVLYVCDRTSVHVLVHVSVRLSGSVHAHAHASFRSGSVVVSVLFVLSALSVIVCPVSIGTDGRSAATL